MRCPAAILIALLSGSCGSGPAPSAASAPAKPKAEPAKITQFYATDRRIPRGTKGELCYGVEHASKVHLAPPVEEVWPSPSRCFEISPKENTRYTLTAFGDDGSKDSQTVEVAIGAANPRLYDLSVNSQLVRPGDQVVVCFKVENATRVKAGPGHFDPEANCITDRPTQTTSYKISALGEDGKADSGTVTVKVK